MGIAEITFSITVNGEWSTRTVVVDIDDEVLEDFGMTTEEYINEDPAKDLEETIIGLAFDTPPEDFEFQHYDDIIIVSCPAEISYDPREDERNPRNLDW